MTAALLVDSVREAETVSVGEAFAASGEGEVARSAGCEAPPGRPPRENWSVLSDELEHAPKADRVGPYTAGDVIADKYQLVRVLCQGGMGSVWVAYNQVLDVEVALKLIRPDVKGSFMTERLMTEARLAARLEHPAIIGVHDLGNTDRGDPYLVMELLHGRDLRSLLDSEGKLQSERAVQLMLPIGEGLAVAHSKGVVHRDLKPENVFLSRVDERIQPKILDFGIAKPALAPGQRRITRAGAVVGSPDYMSPEQARGLDADHRADVWAFCAVLYECVTGRAPFADSAYDNLLRDIVEKPVMPLDRFGINEPELWAILSRGLAKDRDARYPNLRELGRELSGWLRSRGVEEDICGHSLRATWLRPSNPELGSELDPLLVSAERTGLSCSPPPAGCEPLNLRGGSAAVACRDSAAPQLIPSPIALPSQPPVARASRVEEMKRKYDHLKVMAMLACSALLGAGAMEARPFMSGAPVQLASGAVAPAALVAERGAQALAPRPEAEPEVEPVPANTQPAAPLATENAAPSRTTAASRALRRSASSNLKGAKATAAGSTRAVRAGWPFTKRGPRAAEPAEKVLPVRGDGAGRGVRAKYDPEFGF